MAGVGFDAEQDRRVTGLQVLQRSCKFVAVRRIDPIVVGGNVDQHGGISATLETVQGRIGIQRAAISFFVGSAAPITTPT